MIEIHHLDVRHFAIEHVRHLANGCAVKCGCIGLTLFRYLSHGTIICEINIIVFVSVYACRACDALVASCATVH